MRGRPRKSSRSATKIGELGEDCLSKTPSPLDTSLQCQFANPGLRLYSILIGHS